MKHVFTYGSLMFAPVWEQIVTRPYRSDEAHLAGYRRLAVHRQDYPVIKPQTGAGVAGVLYFDVSPPDLARLDAFEGEYYRRTSVNVVLSADPANPGGAQFTAEAYVLRPAFYAIATGKEWDPDRFAREGIKRFVARYRGFG